MKKHKGVTLVTLVITIIIMLIIVGTSIGFLMGKEDVIEKTDVTTLAVELKNLQQQVESKIANLKYKREDIDKYQTLESLGITGSDYSSYIIIREGEMYIKTEAAEKLKEAAKMAEIASLYEAVSNEADSITITGENVGKIVNYRIYRKRNAKRNTNARRTSTSNRSRRRWGYQCRNYSKWANTNNTNCNIKAII